MAAKGDVKLVADIKDGYTDLAHDFLDAWCRTDLSGAENRIMWFLIRRTLGASRRSDKTKVQFDLILASDMSIGTGLKKSCVHRCIASLTKKNIVISEKASVLLAGQRNASSFTGERFYGINFDTETWKV